MTRIIGGLLLATALAGCATSGGGSGTSARTPRNVLTFEEINELNVATAYEAIQRLRPEYLRSRGATSVRNPAPDYAVVYIDGMRAGGLATLQQIRAIDVQEIRYLSATEATTPYGTGHVGGVIEVTTRR